MTRLWNGHRELIQQPLIDLSRFEGQEQPRVHQVEDGLGVLLVIRSDQVFKPPKHGEGRFNLAIWVKPSMRPFRLTVELRREFRLLCFQVVKNRRNGLVLLR